MDEREGVLASYAGRPVEFAREVLDADPWEAQEAVLRALAEERRVTVRSCHGVGKSWLSACAVLWFLYTRAPVTVLTTAPTHRQVREVLWREIRRLYRRLPAGLGGVPLPRGELRETALRLADDRFALGLTTDEPDRFQGFHAPHLLVVVDEASGVDESIYHAIDGVLTGGEARLLLVGNPLHAAGQFYESHRREGWRAFAISALDSPNVRGRDLEDPLSRDAPPARPGLVTARWVWERRSDWGESSPLYQSRVLGQFPDQASDALIRLSWIEAAMRRGEEPGPEPGGPVELGVDVARFGECETVVCVRRGPRVRAVVAWRGADLMETAARVAALAREHAAEVVRVDSAGLGSGAADRLRQLLGDRVVDVNVGRPPRDRERFVLLRDEIFFALRDRFRDGDIALPRDARLRDQLAALTYTINARGQQQVESKSALGARGEESPDRADALALAFAAGGVPRPGVLAGRPR